MNFKKQFNEGLLTKNPVTVQLLGMCSTLAITTSLFNGIGMGLAVTIILICSNVLISALRKVIPSQIRIAAYITIIAGFVTVVDLLLQAFIPALSESLGVFIPLIVVNCIVLGRAEAFASKNGVLASAVDGLCQGIGYTVALIIVCVVRELLASAACYLINLLLVALGLSYMQTVAFILVIASIVQVVEMFLKKAVPALYKALGVFLPLITTNCAVLGVVLVNVQEGYNFLLSVVNGAAGGLGFTVAIVLFASIRERVNKTNCPECFKGFPIALISAGLLALAFMGFSGLSIF